MNTTITTTTGDQFVQDEVLPGMEAFVPADPTPAIGTWQDFLGAAVATVDGPIKAYAVSKIANTVLQYLEVDRVLPPQMFYNYSRKGMIAPRVKDEKGLNTNHLYTADEVTAFLTKYITKNIIK
jgi:hypothetical protein